MRIWSLHPMHLDTKGLVALWRETLLAQHVLAGKTKGYKNHPQLDRFKRMPNPLEAINCYLSTVYEEATARGYHFNREKIDWNFQPCSMTVTDGQVQYETAHLLQKLKTRDPARFEKLSKTQPLNTHPLFRPIKGGIEEWEITE
ncbi:hypothetical protein BFP72_00465 [Reichenbachiella sp. 5M10]|uniref:pyrimidine dimer DNA glycosylase/endonuclease V n=1 Tax=Reichenbachiella sp. 5M10 TaxID=1889772 RepID=UPI000C14C043|nr:pyrimidine dimer DNA glycosylase/endonuclease V [Reichenbachiella sp. 5M10]PIB34010.1 hypothetical protein BFP72_00465 [Reichenbachiella sp. 5M10]